MWTVDHLADIESDFSVFHRVDDCLSLAGPEFFRKAYRLSAYAGVMQARAMAEHEHSRPAGPAAATRGREETKVVSLEMMQAEFPDLIERG